jgi:diguanylate cyclase (GGDEF)-like protein
MMNKIERLGRLPKPLLLSVGFIFVLLLGVIDYLTGRELSFSIFYLIPICMVAWFTHRRNGIMISVASAVIWFIAEVASGPPYAYPYIPYWNVATRFGFFLIVNHMLSALKSTLEREREMARTDSLTGVANGRAFYELSKIEINKARRYGRPFTTMYIDLDNFKMVNDSFGHSIGDALLRSVAGTIQKNIRVTDVVARLGGDEFVVLLPETSGEAAQVVVKKLQQRLLSTMKENGWPVTFSIGAITFVDLPESVDEMLQKTDRLMYSAKKSGRNRIIHEVTGEPLRIS